MHFKKYSRKNGMEPVIIYNEAPLRARNLGSWCIFPYISIPTIIFRQNIFIIFLDVAPDLFHRRFVTRDKIHYFPIGLQLYFCSY